MQRRLHFAAAWLLALLLAQAIGGLAQAQQVTGAKLVVARQEIQAELATALADGDLTPMKQYKILLHAKEILPPEDVQGLERTMVRLSSLGRAVQAQGSAAPAAAIAGATAAKGVTGSGPALAGYTAPVGSPFQYEEVGPGPMSDRPGGLPSLEAMPGGTVHQQSAGELVMQTFGDNIVFANCEAGLLGGDGCLQDNLQSVWEQTYKNASLFTGVDAFKGPIDLFVPNGNFGVDFGFNLGIPLAKELGIGVQAGGRGPCCLISRAQARPTTSALPQVKSVSKRSTPSGCSSDFKSATASFPGDSPTTGSSTTITRK